MQQVFEQCIVKNQKHDTKYKVLLLFEKKDLFAAFIRKVLEKVNNNNKKTLVIQVMPIRPCLLSELGFNLISMI